jgi:hypothetical protein
MSLTNITASLAALGLQLMPISIETGRGVIDGGQRNPGHKSFLCPPEVAVYE